ncbi:hypothetical protein CEXT_805311 [Caerostris extrusa]|uniref:Uncharacterized protein n=1 Tax=Caerostris extrusa TaxID=172846 RepID=A0AAV4U1G0_CAEEX|nr:hypothetical protein CEXT_805311 [Caerostris extrusa]
MFQKECDFLPEKLQAFRRAALYGRKRWTTGLRNDSRATVKLISSRAISLLVITGRRKYFLMMSYFITSQGIRFYGFRYLALKVPVDRQKVCFFQADHRRKEENGSPFMDSA